MEGKAPGRIITIRGKRWKDEPYEKKIESDARSVSFYDGYITEIDLRPLNNHSSLKELILSFNEFETINLHPLEGCSDLKKCEKLQHINLDKNRIDECDITPLFCLPGLGSGWFCFSTGFSIDENVTLYAKKSYKNREFPRGLWKQKEQITWV